MWIWKNTFYLIHVASKYLRIYMYALFCNIKQGTTAKYYMYYNDRTATCIHLHLIHMYNQIRTEYQYYTYSQYILLELTNGTPLLSTILQF